MRHALLLLAVCVAPGGLPWLLRSSPRHLAAPCRPAACRVATRGLGENKEFDYFDVYDKDGFLQLLDAASADAAAGKRPSVGEEEKIARMLNFLEMEKATSRPAESPKLIGEWSLAFCGVGRGLQTEPVRRLLKSRKDYMFKTPVNSQTLVIAEGSLHTEIALANPGEELEKVVEDSDLSIDAKGEVLEEKAGFKRFLKVTYLDDDLLILRGRGPSEVYRRAA